MDKLEKINFDYSLLDAKTSNALQAKAYRINQLTSKTAYEIGKELKEAQDELSKKGYGIFTEWFESLGFKKTKAYQYINHYDFVRSESERSNIEMFETLPKSLQSEMSKPSADPELNQKVYVGDITTHKEYKEQEKIINEQEKTIEEQQKIINDQANQKPEVIEKEITKEVIPHDYDGLKSDNQQLSQALREAQKEEETTRLRNKRIEKERDRLQEDLNSVDEKSQKYDQLNEAMQELNGKLNDGQRRLKAQKEVYDLIKAGERAVIELAPLSYLIDAENVMKSEYARKPIEKLMNNLDDISNRLSKALENTIIIEG